MGFLTDVGKTGTISSEMKNITSLAAQMRGEKAATEDRALRTQAFESQQEVVDLQKQKLQNELEAQQIAKTPVLVDPYIDQVTQQFGPQAAQYMLNKAQASGLVTKEAGGYMTQRGHQEKITKLFDNFEDNQQVVGMGLAYARQQYDQARQALIDAQGNPKKMEAANQAYLAAAAKIEQLAGMSDQMSQMEQKLIGKYSPEAVQQWRISGDLADLEGREITTGAGATPTDIDDFVADANREAARLTGKELTPGENNKARLQFKRAQATEVATTRLAEKTVDAQTAETIKFNSEMGTRLAQIATAGDLLKARGELSPEDKKAAARKGVSGKLASMAKHYINLDSMNAIVNVDDPSFDNILASARSSSIGQVFGNLLGTDAQSIRNSIKAVKPLLIQDVRKSTDMGARGMDSEKELKFYLQAVTDEKVDIQSNIAAMVVLDEAFGDGTLAKELRGMTDESLIKRIADEGAAILSGGEGSEITTPKTQTEYDALPSGAVYIDPGDGQQYRKP